ncbi:DUF572 domain-containing protein [Cordyceps fumosorosea ARSEF 2679]|uniref:DUF572 domain-containing protein n=1 Tax=Cordyceps fumosorosea (strain ARSEF 2679) TaxID=1081104 RepID=A0A162MLK8_CORFA|nr:DUF572 domain-containing protein [Cordyceps fumosorosea ARSEF 2679]OAA63820.1 DUF572 domain-containing protein [Cordyceps fumosorosea ARSEF 2679]
MGRYVPPEHEGTASGNALHGKTRRLAAPPTVRFEMPYAAWCATCPRPTLIPQGTRFNAEKRRAGRYHTTPIWSFRFRHAVCGGAVEMRTDPQNTAYVVVSGATRRDTGDDKEEEEEVEGGVARLTEAQRVELRGNAFASLERTIEDRERLVRGAHRLDGLADAADRHWRDPYARNQQLRRAFRRGRHEREASAKETEALQARMSLGMDILPETAEDARRARLVDFAAEGEDEGGDDGEPALSKPLFETPPPVKQEGGERGKWKGMGRTKGARKRVQTREAFATQVVGNTRAAKDPFLLTGTAGTRRGVDGKAAAKIPGIKRKRVALAAQVPEPPGTNLPSGPVTSKAAALVEYDSD